MISGINLCETIDYILTDSKESKDNPTIWKLGMIPSYVYSKIQSGENRTDAGFQLCQVGIKGWQNLKDVEFKTEKIKIGMMEVEQVPLDLLSRIPERFLAELSVKIQQMNNLTEDEAKN
jgi:hypothetical protein